MTWWVICEARAGESVKLVTYFAVSSNYAGTSNANFIKFGPVIKLKRNETKTCTSTNDQGFLFFLLAKNLQYGRHPQWLKN